MKIIITMIIIIISLLFIAADVIISIKIKAKQRNLNQLNDNLNHLNDKINSTNKHLSDLQAKENDLNGILDVISATIKEAQIKIPSALQELHAAQDSLVIVQAQLKEGRQETASYEHLKGRLRELEDRVAAAQEEVSRLNTDEGAKKEILTALQSEENQLLAKIGNLKTEIDEQNTQLDQLKESYRQAIGLVGKVGEEGVRRIESFHLTSAQEKMLALLDEVVGLYPELREALMTVA